MKSVLEKTIEELLKQDIDGQYTAAINLRYSRFGKKSSIEPDDLVKKTVNIIFSNIEEAEALFKQASFYKDAGFIMKIILKTLKIAQKMLVALLFQSPFRVGIAYNALHVVIKYFERESKKKEMLKK